MNKIITKKNLNVILLLLLLSQLLIFIGNTESQIGNSKYSSNSLEKFKTIIAGENGNNVISADKLIKLDEKKSFLVGNTNLVNDDYNINSKNVIVDNETRITSSSEKTTTINNQGTMTSEGFEYNQETNIILFNGNSEFYGE